MPRKSRDWSLHPERFHNLLRRLGDPDGVRYHRLRARLEKHFEHSIPHDLASDPRLLADITIDRLAVKLEDNAFEPSQAEFFAIGIARHVLDEERRAQTKIQRLAAEFRNRWLSRAGPDYDCIERSLEMLEPNEKTLIEDYYPHGGTAGTLADHRRRLAQRIGISSMALSTRAYEVKKKLKDLYRDCCEKRREFL